MEGFMPRMIDIDYEASQLISNCNEELSHIRSEINSNEMSIRTLEKRSGMDKLFHMGDIKRKKEKLKREIDDFCNFIFLLIKIEHYIATGLHPIEIFLNLLLQRYNIAVCPFYIYN